MLSNGNLHYFWDLERGNPYLITSFPTPDSVDGYKKVQPKPERLIVPPLISWTDKTQHTQAAGCKCKALAGLNRRLEAKTLNQPMLVVESAKCFQCPHQFRYRLEVPDPQQLLLERPEGAFDTAIAFRLANECR